MTRIKICGLSRPQDVAYVNRARPDWCGFVVNFPKSRRSVTTDQLRALRRELDASPQTSSGPYGGSWTRRWSPWGYLWTSRWR